MDDTLPELKGPSPCDLCESREYCAEGRACHDFWIFVQTGRVIRKSRMATMATYKLISMVDGFDDLPEYAHGVTDEPVVDDEDLLISWFLFATGSMWVGQ